MQGTPRLWDVVSGLRARGFLGSGHLSCQLGIAGSVEKVPVEPGRDSRALDSFQRGTSRVRRLQSFTGKTSGLSLREAEAELSSSEGPLRERRLPWGTEGAAGTWPVAD